MKPNRDSEIKARFAQAVLRVAQAADPDSAVRLLEGLAKDFPHPDERREIASLHFEAIEAFEKLIADRSGALPAWKRATDAVSKWLGAVENT